MPPDLQSGPVDHFGIPANLLKLSLVKKVYTLSKKKGDKETEKSGLRAEERIRTPDLGFTKALLCP